MKSSESLYLKSMDISVNLSRVSDWILSDSKRKQDLVDQFLKETQQILSEITTVPDHIKPTFERFRKEFNKLLKDRHNPNRYDWAEKALT